MLSIIIPCLNEEKCLPFLLQSIKEQDFSQKIEVIVADADSKDKTREIAQQFGCKVVRGGNMSQGRNRGAEAAQGDLLLFADADTALPKQFLKEALKKFQKKGLDGTTFFIYPIERGFFKKLLLNIFHNYLILLAQRMLALGSMVFLVKRKVHNQIGGFNEEIVFLEDSEYLKRLAKTGKYRILRSPQIFVSTRRFRKDGWIKSCLKVLAGNIYFFIFGPIKKDIFHYRFGHHNDVFD